MTATLADGAYVVLSAAAPTVALDVSDQGDAAGTNVACHTRNGSNAQFVYVTTNSDKTRTLYFPLTGKVLDVTGGVYAAGTNVETWDNTGQDPAKFTITDAGTAVEVDGAQVECFVGKGAGAVRVPGGDGRRRVGAERAACDRRERPGAAGVGVQAAQDAHAWDLPHRVGDRPVRRDGRRRRQRGGRREPDSLLAAWRAEPML